jgi:hypothetical protein
LRGAYKSFVTHSSFLNILFYNTKLEAELMADRNLFGGIGNFFGGNATILFFIIVFLLLFDGGGLGIGNCKDPC